MPTNTKLTIYLIFLSIPYLIFSVQNCTANKTLQQGCIVCDNTTTHARIFNLSESLYTCTDQLNCLMWNQTNCLTCKVNHPKNDTNSICTYAQGCITITNGTCSACSVNYYLETSTNTCKFLDRGRCQIVNADGTCERCLRPQMDPQNNCNVSPTACANYNYDLLKCEGCQIGQKLDSSGSFCYVPVNKCLYYDLIGCLKCEKNYYFVPGNDTCEQAFPVKIFTQYYQQGNFLNICRQRNHYYDQALLQCVKTTSMIQNCQAQSSSICANCIDGYYLASPTSCQPCQLGVSNCLVCLSATKCSTCKDGYFFSERDSGVCFSCQLTFGCPECRSSTFNSSYIEEDQVQCLKCNEKETLFNGRCYQCPNGFGFDIKLRDCVLCSISNCQKCQQIYMNNTSYETCLWCNDGHFFDRISGVCISLSNLNITNLNIENAYQILTKASPLTNQLIYNNQTKLKINCGDQTDGYICRCAQSKLIAAPYTYNSLCRAFTTPISLDFSSFFTSTNIAIKQFALYSQQIRMASQFPNYALTIASPATGDSLSYEQFATLLQIHQTRTIHSASLQPYHPNLYSITRDFMRNVFPIDRNTLIFGNGFHFKYSPNNALLSSSFLQKSSSFYPSGRLLTATFQTSNQEQYIKATVNTSSWIMIFVRFDPQPRQNLTGQIYVFTGDDVQYECNLTVRKIGNISDVASLSVFVNDIAQTEQNTVSLSSGYLNFKMKTSTSTAPQSYQIVYQVATDATTTDPYSMQRIQNLFYNESFIYIIFFVIVYLIAIPVFSIVDFCENDMHKRKVVNQNQITESNEGSRKYQEREQNENIIFINYKEFFPLYNIGSTPRPRRIIKLCLFILNVQHSVTFLTLIYFTLAAAQPIAAVALGIPAYLCTVVMGYICGLANVLIPGNFKYLVNLIVPGYWVLWVILMPRFVSEQYKPFVYIYVCIFFIVDLFLDGCQALLVYFAIYQTQKQTALFSCLARWLSYRGYYQYQSLAKQIIDD